MPAVVLGAVWSVEHPTWEAGALAPTDLAHGSPQSPLSGAQLANTAQLPSLPTTLAQAGLYRADAWGQLQEAAVFYVPQYPLWSDGADKKRWVVLPPHASIDGSQPDRWEFPVGTRFFKEFSVAGKVETRMIEKRADGSYGYAAYVWDEAETEAVLAAPAGEVVQGKRTYGEPYLVPAEAECRACHEGRTASPILGFGALQLSTDRDPGAAHADAPPDEAVDLRDLIERELLEGYPADSVAPRIGAPNPTARAAAGYLFGNCAHCHNAEGPLADIGLNFDQSVVDAQAYARLRAAALAPTELFQLPGETHARRAIPGDAARSAITLRMNSRSPITQMPPLGTSRVDTEGVRLISDWINSLQ